MDGSSTEAQDALATALFDAYFRDGVNVADHTQLTQLAERADLDSGRVREFLATGEGGAEVREEVAAERRDGVTTVPRFIFENGEMIVGVTSTEALGDAIRQAAAGNASLSLPPLAAPLPVGRGLPLFALVPGG